MDASNTTAENTSSAGDNDESQDYAGAAKLSAALSPKKRAVLDELLKPDSSVPRAAEKTGTHRGTINRWMLSDADFIAAYNARLLEIETANSTRLLALIPKALQAIEEAIDNGDARLAMQLLKAWMLAPKHARVLSAATVAEQLKVDELRHQVELHKTKVELESEREQTFHKSNVVDVARWARTEQEKPTEQAYEESRRFYYTAMAEAPAKNARYEEIDARVRAEVEQMMADRKKQEAAKANPGSAPRASDATVAPVESPAAANPGATTLAAESKPWKAAKIDPRVAAAAQKLAEDLSNPGAGAQGRRGE